MAYIRVKSPTDPNLWSIHFQRDIQVEVNKTSWAPQDST